MPVSMFVSKSAACLTEHKNAAQCVICLKSYILKRKHGLERKRYRFQMRSHRIQFNVHIEQRQRLKEKSSFAFSFTPSFSVNEPLRKRISLSASKTGNYEKECKKETVTFELCCLP